MEDLDAFLEIYNTRRPRPRPQHGGKDAIRDLPAGNPSEARKPETPGPKGDGGRSVEPDFDDAGCQVIAVLVQSYHLR